MTAATDVGAAQMTALAHVKVFAEPGEFDLALVIPIFHRWIREDVVGGMPLDVADYRHVHHGPGVMLIGHETDRSLDWGEGRLGALYACKQPLVGEPAEQLYRAIVEALQTARALEEESSLAGLRFRAHELLVVLNDRLAAPNDDRTEAVVRPALQEALETVWGVAAADISRHGEPRDRFGLYALAERELTVAEALARVHRPTPAE